MPIFSVISTCFRWILFVGYIKSMPTKGDTTDVIHWEIPFVGTKYNTIYSLGRDRESYFWICFVQGHEYDILCGMISMQLPHTNKHTHTQFCSLESTGSINPKSSPHDNKVIE